ncbi:unnamed protein product [Candida verbasci]|uniref:Zn(2)-C6 fungal-type domain-containing protein n=1 Tax=Candida verbasci TaxID=1227364 RepID=A0A9W4TQK5_9ASCO|nr:unnamed protein product [Candida verbasci]
MKTTKEKRASIACNTCRESKLRCINNCDQSSCQRCSTLNLPCTYTLKTSQLKKRKLTKMFKPTITNLEINTVILPDKKLIIEVVEIFFENQYKGIFPLFHKPTFITFLKSDSFNPTTFINTKEGKDFIIPTPVTLLAILALCSRLHSELPKIYGNFDELRPNDFFPHFTQVINLDSAANSSKYFGFHCKRLIGMEFDNPTISNIQALCILSSHEWGEGNATKSYMYSGIAARMAFILGLNKEPKIEIEYDNFQNCLRMESKRRAIWSVYMMDRCNASGRKSNSVINLDDIHVNLPCSEKEFLFGNMNKLKTRDEVAQLIDDSDIDELNYVSCNGFLITLFETWREISKWVGETGGKLEKLPPWDTNSPYYKFSKTLDNFELNLPNHLKFDQFNIQAHIADNSAADFAYFHGLFFLCKIFLNREYFYSSPTSSPKNWWFEQSNELFELLDKLDSITKILKPMNLMVIAPFTGFQVFTTSATAYYVSAYPSKILKRQFPNQNLNKKYLKMGDDSLETLKSWSKSWGLGKNWIETLKGLKEVFGKVSNLDDDLRHKMHDYGNIDQTMQIKNLITIDEGPVLDFMNNLNLSGIFPDWNNAMNIQL